MSEKKPLVEDTHYLTGRIDALTSLLLAVAAETMTRQQLRIAGNARLEALEGTLLNTQATDAHLAGIAHTRDWLDQVTG